MKSAIDDFTCPKKMQFGPCGGVEFDGSCEVAPNRCVFLDAPTVRWPGEPVARGIQGRAGAAAPSSSGDTESGGAESVGARLRAVLGRRQIVVGDFPARALDVESARRCAEIMTRTVDAALSGDSGAQRVQFAPTYRAQLIQETGLAAFIGVNCRDRNRVAIEGELAGLAAVGVAAVHCVTGDHTLTGNRPDAQPVFDLDSTRVAALARASGHLVSVGEAPATPPTTHRAARLIEKVKAGADLAFVNHCGGAGPVERFIAEVRALEAAETQAEPQSDAPSHSPAGARQPVRFIACVPLVVDRGSAELLASFTTLVLPEGYLERILGARDVFAEGIAAAIDLSEELLALDGVVGVNLSGGPADGREEHFAEAMVLVAAGTRLRVFDDHGRV
ncbi:methylenetetrahydrofolate reductase C-terminal domain-containing protein [Subtercola endophyticus]|nr:methylenetetrahydrofolate reductase C-terminal domain-containing protein [Subtercola endophyticus]